MAWVDDRLAEHGLRGVGEPTQRVRPWATVFRVETNGGVVWFKASAAETSYEPALIAVLRTTAPERLLQPIALDTERGWSLNPDGGQTLRDVIADAPDTRFDQWEKVLPVYAEVQRKSVVTASELLSAGVPDMTSMQLPGHVRRLMAECELDQHLRARLRDWLPWLVDTSAELAASPVAETIEHDDLHDANVLVHPDGYRFFDWGDACVAHPFTSFLIVRRSTADFGGVEEYGPELTRLADAYLESFTDLEPRSALRRTLDLAEKVAGILRAESWRRAVATATPAEIAEYENPVSAWLDEIAP